MGSEFSNYDMSSPPVEDFSYRIIKDSEEEWVIESTPVSTGKEDEYGFSKKISFIEKSTYLVKKMEFYDFDGQLSKLIEIRGTKEVYNNKYMITNMIAKNLSNGRNSEINISEIRTGSQINDEIFTLAYIER